MHEVEAWPFRSQVAAVQSIVSKAERCGSCGLSEDDGWWVAAVVQRCATCEDSDRRRESLKGLDDVAGLRVNWDHLGTHDESVLESSRAMYTPEGHAARTEHRRQVKAARSLTE